MDGLPSGVDDMTLDVSCFTILLKKVVYSIAQGFMHALEQYRLASVGGVLVCI